MFHSCRLKYKHYYIDGIKSDVESIEMFRGSIVHEVLEEFYQLIKAGSCKPAEWVTAKYDELWDKNYSDAIKIVKKDISAQDYHRTGRQSLLDYYERYKPFDQARVVDTERTIYFSVRYQEKEHPFVGIIDRLDWNDKTDMFEIHDYKVTGTLMTQEEADRDWQLGLYHIALREKWPDVEKARLIWHSLLFNKELISSRTEVELDELKKEVAARIDEIEGCADFYPSKSVLCQWCDYQEICPVWKHSRKMAGLSINEYKNDPGVKLVSEYVKLEGEKEELKEKICEIEQKQEKIKETVLEFAEREKVSMIDGPAALLKIDVKEECRTPMKREDTRSWEGLRDLLIKEGKYVDVSTVNNNMVSYRIRMRMWPPQFVEKVKKFLKHQVTKTIAIIKK